MAVIRGTLTVDSYTIVPNEWLRDPRLSYKAKGILAYIMSHRADYELTVEQMVEQSSDGAASIYSGVRELVGVGYLLREQRRNPNGTMGPIDYRVADKASTASQGTACGKPRSGADLGEQEELPGQTASRKTARGKTARGKSKTKKEQPPTGVEEEHPQEDEEPPTPSPAPSAESAAPPPEEGEGRVEPDQPQRDPAENMIREAVAARPAWSPKAVGRVVHALLAERGDVDLVRTALMLAAGDAHTRAPTRLLHDACPHWTEAVRVLQRGHSSAAAANERAPCRAGVCDGSGRFVQVVDRREVRGFKDGQPIFGTVQDEVPATCTACDPSYRPAASASQGV